MAEAIVEEFEASPQPSQETLVQPLVTQEKIAHTRELQDGPIPALAQSHPSHLALKTAASDKGHVPKDSTPSPECFWEAVKEKILLPKQPGEKASEHWHSLVRDHDTSDGDEDHCSRPKLGAGPLGRGPPLQVRGTDAFRGFHDGASLCSPGRWRPPFCST